MRNYRSLLLGCLAISALGCGGATDSGVSPVRAIHLAKSVNAIDVVTDLNEIAAGLAYGDASSFANVSTASPSIFVNNSGTGASIATLDVSLVAGSAYTVVDYDPIAGGAPVVGMIIDDRTAPAAGSFRFRVFEFADSVQSAVDVYLLLPGQDIATAAPAVSGLTPQTVSGYTSKAPNNTTGYRVVVTNTGSKTILADLTSFVPAAGQIDSIVLESGSGNAITFQWFTE